MVLGRGEHRRGGNSVAGWVGVSVGTESIGGAPGGGVLTDGVASGVEVASAVIGGENGGVVVGLGDGGGNWNGKSLWSPRGLGSRG